MKPLETLQEAKAGCVSEYCGLESGSYQLRKNLLNKNITDEQIMACGRMLRKQGITVSTTNIFCLPGESFEDAVATIRLNIQAETEILLSHVFVPLSGPPI